MRRAAGPRASWSAIFAGLWWFVATVVVPQVVAATGVKPPDVRNEATAFLQQPASTNANRATMSPQDATKAIAASPADLTAGGDEAKAARDRVAPIMVAQLKISRCRKALRCRRGASEAKTTAGGADRASGSFGQRLRCLARIPAGVRCVVDRSDRCRDCWCAGISATQSGESAADRLISSSMEERLVQSTRHIDPNRIGGTLQALLGRVQDGFGRATGTMRTQVRGKAHRMAGTAQRGYGEALDSARTAMAEAATQVEKRPFLSVLIAGTVGYGLALLGRRHKDFN